jgi:hypothetical protein
MAIQKQSSTLHTKNRKATRHSPATIIRNRCIVPITPGLNGQKEGHSGESYSSSSPKTLPVVGFTRWTCWQARQVTV